MKPQVWPVALMLKTNHPATLLLTTHVKQLSSVLLVVFALVLFGSTAPAETCMTADEMDASTRTALDSTGKRFYSMVTQGDTASLRQNSIPAVASDFGGIEAAVNENKATLASGRVTSRPPYLLQAGGSQTLARAEFYCGIFNSPDRVGFVIPNLPPGNYAIVIEDVATDKGPYTVSFVLQQQGTDWKLGGFYVKSGQVGGHDGNWFINKAQEFKNKGQRHNAYFYYWEARELMAPVPFMGTSQLDKLYDASQQVAPADLPSNGPVDLVGANGKTYKVTQIFPVNVGTDLDLVVKYQSNNVSDTAQAFSDNMAVMKGLVAKYPEYRDGFAAIVARAVDGSGRDYGSLLAMKDIK